MTPSFLAYGSLATAIVCEVAGSAFLQKSEQFSRIGPVLAMTILYGISFFFLSQALKGIPLGVAYAIWGGLGIVLTAFVSVTVFRQAIDVAALVGIAMIVSGVVVMQVFSRTTVH
ncbi:multidrug efflux SMR transporter [Mesorhizobium sp. YC-39]|uniref:DMT family transporter n=1 Tax=unclassified Mesorhizobium TaxID=325217 RepID=UPI0021E6EE66|nr:MULTISPECIES: multidrug efflux SMR transporter [unclassified Mesorhizobium]MCV3210994.1 multidrug efflux SMR transporter [Mesorhizobium sp. YC-2]MCV3232719.1 multidrug efflux SMR transporter [Mesorhizobium sp. YC-39]